MNSRLSLKSTLFWLLFWVQEYLILNKQLLLLALFAVFFFLRKTARHKTLRVTTMTKKVKIGGCPLIWKCTFGTLVYSWSHVFYSFLHVSSLLLPMYLLHVIKANLEKHLVSATFWTYPYLCEKVLFHQIQPKLTFDAEQEVDAIKKKNTIVPYCKA